MDGEDSGYEADGGLTDRVAQKEQRRASHQHHTRRIEWSSDGYMAGGSAESSAGAISAANNRGNSAPNSDYDSGVAGDLSGFEDISRVHHRVSRSRAAGRNRSRRRQGRGDSHRTQQHGDTTTLGTPGGAKSQPMVESGASGHMARAAASGGPSLPSVSHGGGAGAATRATTSTSSTAARRAPWGGVTRYSPLMGARPPSAVLQAALASGRSVDAALRGDGQRAHQALRLAGSTTTSVPFPPQPTGMPPPAHMAAAPLLASSSSAHRREQQQPSSAGPGKRGGGRAVHGFEPSYYAGMGGSGRKRRRDEEQTEEEAALPQSRPHGPGTPSDGHADGRTETVLYPASPAMGGPGGAPRVLPAAGASAGTAESAAAAETGQADGAGDGLPLEGRGGNRPARQRGMHGSGRVGRSKTGAGAGGGETSGDSGDQADGEVGRIKGSGPAEDDGMDGDGEAQSEASAPDSSFRREFVPDKPDTAAGYLPSGSEGATDEDMPSRAAARAKTQQQGKGGGAGRRRKGM